LLLRRRRYARDRALRPRHQRGVADHEYLRMPRQCQVRLHRNPPTARGLDLEPASGGRRGDAGRPDQRAACDALVADDGAVRVAAADRHAEPDLDTEPRQRLGGNLGEALRKAR
jgi:hypothetical protein